MLVQVVIETGGRTERRVINAPDGTISIGRSHTCTLPLDSAMVSRTHVNVDLNGPAMLVTDVSTNGTLAGDRFVRGAAAEVAFGMPILVGDCMVWLRSGGERSPLPADVAAPAAQNAAFATPAPTMPPPAAGAKGAPYEGVAPSLSQGPDVRAIEQARERARRESVALRREIHRRVLEHLGLATIEPSKMDDPSLRPKVLNALRRMVKSIDERIPQAVNREVLVGELADEALGLGPLERFLADPSVNEIMVVDPNTIYIEQSGKRFQADARFTDDERVRIVIERIVAPLGRRVDESSPLVDARLSDGSRVNVVIRPLALRGSAITIRKFARTALTMDKLIEFGAMTPQIARFLTRSVVAKKNVVIAGSAGSGKTTLLNVLSGAIPPDERIVSIEDTAELQLRQPHVVSLETRPANVEGKGETTVRDLVKNALRMRPDRIVVGECRGGEALDVLQAMNSGHDGSLTTTHANSPREALSRLETLVLMAGIDLPIRAVREQIAGSVHLLVQQTRLPDGSRKVTAVSEVTGIDDGGEIDLVPLFEFTRTGTGPKNKVLGEFRATGFLPTFLNDFIVMGLVQPGEPYL
jgi:pilus assembly protein CpaF